MFASISLPTDLAASESLSWDMAKQIIQSQHSLAIYGITAVVAVAAGLMFAFWIWNIFLRKHELEKAIEPLRSEVFGEMKKDFAHLKKEITDESSKVRQEIEKNLSSQLTSFEGDTAKIMGFINGENNWHAEAAGWYAEGVMSYAKCKDDHNLRLLVVALLRSLKKCEKQKMSLSKNQRARIGGCLSCIPEFFGEEKEEIEDKLNKLSG